jgi:thiol-disulfide isomerase/thioredoxin
MKDFLFIIYMKIKCLHIILIILILLIIIKSTKEYFEVTDYESKCETLPSSLADQSCWCESPKEYLFRTNPSRDFTKVSEIEKIWNCQQNGQKTYLLFYTDWCSFSNKMMPIWESISIRENTNPNKKFIKINCDKLSENNKGPHIAEYYNVKQLPTILLVNGLNKDTDVIKYTGEIDERQLARFVSQN